MYSASVVSTPLFPPESHTSETGQQCDSAVELVVAEVGVAGERPGLDQDSMPSVVGLGEAVAGSVGGVGEHVESGGFVGEEFDAGGAVAGVRWCEITCGDQPGRWFDRDVGFVAVAI